MQLKGVWLYFVSPPGYVASRDRVRGDAARDAAAARGLLAPGAWAGAPSSSQPWAEHRGIGGLLPRARSQIRNVDSCYWAQRLVISPVLLLQCEKGQHLCQRSLYLCIALYVCYQCWKKVNCVWEKQPLLFPMRFGKQT